MCPSPPFIAWQVAAVGTVAACAAAGDSSFGSLARRPPYGPSYGLNQLGCPSFADLSTRQRRAGLDSAAGRTRLGACTYSEAEQDTVVEASVANHEHLSIDAKGSVTADFVPAR